MIDIVCQNKALSEPFSELVHKAFAGFRMDQVSNWDYFLQQENNEVGYELSETKHDQHDQDNYEDNNERNQCQSSDNSPGQVRTTVLDDHDIGDRIKTLYFKQRQVFDFVYD